MNGLRSTHSSRGYTLIETLAVVCLLAMLAGVVLGGLRGQRHVTRARDARRTLATADQAARHAARSGQRVELCVSGSSVVVRAADTHELRATFDLDARTQVQFLHAAGMDMLGLVSFDARGRSPDYEVVIREGEQEQRVSVSGTTGWMEPMP